MVWKFQNTSRFNIANMILPVIAYGDPVLKKKADEIDENYPNLKELIENMFETMYASNGVGIAAPQIGRSLLSMLLP